MWVLLSQLFSLRQISNNNNKSDCSVRENTSESPAPVISWENAGESMRWTYRIYPDYFLWSPCWDNHIRNFSVQDQHVICYNYQLWPKGKHKLPLHLDTKRIQGKLYVTLFTLFYTYPMLWLINWSLVQLGEAYSEDVITIAEFKGYLTQEA